jgi:superfamily I DNA/RNA helicase
MTTGTGLDPARAALVADIARLVAAARAKAPALACFAHLRVRSRERVRDYLLANVTLTTDAVTVLNWQSAPLAEAFFACPAGSDYEIRAGERTLTGEVLARNLIELDAGELVTVTGEGVRFTRNPDGTWSAAPDPDANPVPVRDDGRTRYSSAVEVPLDETQMQAVTRPAGEGLLVLGEAGAGKTTVALHRLAHLRRQRKEGAFKAAVIVPTEGLRRLSESLLARLDIADADVAVYDGWAGRLAKRAFLDIPVRESEDATASVIHLKRHRALLRVLARYAAATPRKGKVRVKREDLHHFFGDSAWMDKVVDASEGAIPSRAVQQVTTHTAVQFADTTEDSHSHVVDAARLQTVDGRAIDAGTRLNDAKTVDAEDYAVLFELDRLRAQGRGEATPALPRSYDLVIVDEAQELAPLELRLLGRSIVSGGTLVVAGDAGQQVDTAACFTDWATTMRDLGARDHHVAELTTLYRCPAAVTELARHVLDPGHPLPVLEPSGPVGFLRAANECHLLARLTEALRMFTTAAPQASVAVITRAPESAERLARLLGRGADVRLALNGEFRFGAGVSVTAVQEVKGLEFDHVIIPDGSSSVYPDSGEARRALYVAITRAVHHVLFATTGAWTSLVG